MIIKYVKDDILNSTQKYIAHGVNCQNTMKSGVAKVLFEKYPTVKTEYHELFKNFYATLINGSEDLLGTCQFVKVEYNKYVINCFTQDNFGYKGDLYLSYNAIKDVFKTLDEHGIEEIAIPKIGCGLAGGHWEAVETIINLSTPNMDVYVYDK